MTRFLQLILLSLTGTFLFSCSSYPSEFIVRSISEDEILGTLIQHNVDRPDVVIIFLHGSAGPMPPEILVPLADQRISILMLDYFGRRGLPGTLENISLEYIEKGVTWVRKTYPSTPIIMMGQSRGAELSLIYCSWFDNVDGVIAYSPSGIHIAEAVQYQSGESRIASWTFHGEGLAFAEIEALPEEGGSYDYKDWFDLILGDSALFQHARIPIERSQCPMLLMSGTQDRVWPSAEMVNRMLETADSSIASRISPIQYEDAGHQFLFFGDEAPSSFSSQQSFWLRGKRYKFPFGGTREGNQQAMIDSRNQTLGFIERMVDSQSSHQKSPYLSE